MRVFGGQDLRWRHFFFVFGNPSELGKWETVSTGFRDRQRASVDVERVVEAQSGLREWSVRESNGES